MKYRLLGLIFLIILSLSLASCSSVPDLLSSERAITAFTFPTSTATTIDVHIITVTVPFGTNVTNLIATFTASAGASVSVGSTVQQSGITTNDFTNPVVYRVTSAFGWIQDYTVTVTVAVQTSALTKTVVLTGGGTGIGHPFNTGALREMMLYRASEMKGAGTITSISFKYAGSLASAVSCPSVTIRMSHTNQNIFSDTTFANRINTGQGSQQTVLTSSTVNVPAGADDTYYTIPLATPFNYNGVDNLVVEVTRPACDGDVPTRVHDYSGGPNIDLSNTSDAEATIGSLGPWLPDTRFNLSGGDSIVGTMIGGRIAPFTIDATAQKVQLLSLKDEINGSGIITGIAFIVDTATTTARTYTMNVKLGHTNLSALTTTFANNFNVGTPVTAASAVTFTIPAGIPVGASLWIPLPDAAFNYNGTDNLIAEIEVTTAELGDTGGDWGWYTGTGASLVAAASALTGTVKNEHYVITFRFAGGPVDVITPGELSLTFPFSDASDNKSQFLYYATELGTKGSITKVAYRIHQDAIPDVYNSFAVVLGHTTSTTLASTTFSGNMIDAQTVFSGNVTLPASVKAGDWIEIPLSTPFAYDGKRNLVVQMSTLHGSVANGTRNSQNDILYLNRRSFAAGSNTTDTIAGTQNDLGDLRLFMH